MWGDYRDIILLMTEEGPVVCDPNTLFVLDYARRDAEQSWSEVVFPLDINYHSPSYYAYIELPEED